MCKEQVLFSSSPILLPSPLKSLLMWTFLMLWTITDWSHRLWLPHICSLYLRHDMCVRGRSEEKVLRTTKTDRISLLEPVLISRLCQFIYVCHPMCNSHVIFFTYFPRVFWPSWSRCECAFSALLWWKEGKTTTFADPFSLLPSLLTLICTGILHRTVQRAHLWSQKCCKYKLNTISWFLHFWPHREGEQELIVRDLLQVFGPNVIPLCVYSCSWLLCGVE